MAIATASVNSSCSLTGSPPCRGQRIEAASGGSAVTLPLGEAPPGRHMGPSIIKAR